MIVVKYGGHVLENASAHDEIVEAIAQYHLSGQKVVVVHGGGPAVDAELKVHQIPTRMASGYRVTTPEVMELVQSTLSGAVLRNLTNKFIGYGVNAVGISSGDGKILRARKFSPLVNGVPVDIGLVGEAESTDPNFLNLLIENDYLPIVSPVSVATDGLALNINGDIAAGSIAGALMAKEVLFITDVAGIYRNWPDRNSLIDQISLDELKALSETFTDGMAPKSKAVITALSSGASQARVLDGTDIKNVRNGLIGVGGTVVRA